MSHEQLQDKRLRRERNVRIACVYVPYMALRWVEKSVSHGVDHPTVLVEDNRLHQVNAVAYHAGLRLGMRLQAAQSLCPDVQVFPYDKVAFEKEKERLTHALRACSPWVGWHASWPDCFWLRGDGLARVWDNATQWGRSIERVVSDEIGSCTVIVGFSSFSTLVLAHHMTPGVFTFRTLEHERGCVARVPLVRWMPDGRLWEEFSRLGVQTIADLASLPSGGVHRRYGGDAAQWARLAREEASLAIVWTHPPEDLCVRASWDHAIVRHTVLLFALQEPMARLLQQVEKRAYACDELSLTLHFDWPKRVDDRIMKRAQEAGMTWGGIKTVSLHPAVPHTDGGKWSELLRLCLERLCFPTGVVMAEMSAHAAMAQVAQEQWEGVTHVASPRPLLEALARLRVRLGERHVGTLHVRQAHLPDARSEMLPMNDLPTPSPSLIAQTRVIRRMREKPQYLCSCAQTWAPLQPPVLPSHVGEIRGWSGPYRIEGAWWQRSVARSYYYVFFRHGGVWWVYHDHVRASMWLHAHLY